MNFLTKIYEHSPKYIKYFARTILKQPHPALQTNNIALFHGARSGSTVLGDLLNQHPDIFWDREVFSFRRYSNKLLKHLISDPFKLLQFRISLANKTLYGFETQFIHFMSMNMSITDYLNQLKTMGFNQFIILERKNYLRLTTSVLIAWQESKWHQTNRSQPKLSQLYINVNNVFPSKGLSLVVALTRIEDLFDTLKKALNQNKVLHLTYEDDIATNPLIGYKQVCQFIQKPYQPASVRFSKTNPFSLKLIITNFNEVKQILKGTRFEWMLYQ